jgi:hypothetical protein
MEGKTRYKKERKNIQKHKNKPVLYRFLDYCDEFIVKIFNEKACNVFCVTHQDLSNHLAGLLYYEAFSHELVNYEQKFINEANTYNINLGEFNNYKRRMRIVQ